LLWGVDPRGVGLGGDDLRDSNLEKVLTALHTTFLAVASALLLCLAFYSSIYVYLCMVVSYLAFALCWEADMTYPIIG
jgi:hypothetical protein